MDNYWQHKLHKNTSSNIVILVFIHQGSIFFPQYHGLQLYDTSIAYYCPCHKLAPKEYIYMYLSLYKADASLKIFIHIIYVRTPNMNCPNYSSLLNYVRMFQKHMRLQ